MNIVSLQRSAWDTVLDPGLRFRPFEFVMQRGTPLESEIGERSHEIRIANMTEK